MGFRFSKRFSVLPGVRVNVSKSNVSLSLGRRGMTYTKGASCDRVSIGLPGTGLSWTKERKLSARGRAARIVFVRKSIARLAILAVVLIVAAWLVGGS